MCVRPTGQARVHTSLVDVVTLAKYSAAVIGALGGPTVLVRLARAAFPDPGERLRQEAFKNLELFERLPEQSAERVALLGVIDSDVKRLVTEARGATRDWGSLGLGSTLILLAAVGARWGVLLTGWWQVPVWIGVSVLLVFGVTGVAIGLPKRRRDGSKS